ncbi:MAG: thioredoxin domain-containing protein, partial [Bacteroidota bacterium]
FYLWTKEQVLGLLGPEAGQRFALYYGIEDEGNAFVDPQHEFAGKNILHIAEDLAALSRTVRKPEPELAAELERSRNTLLLARSKRPRPLKDDKILTAWNGLLIGALARSGWVLASPSYVDAARQTARFLLHSLHDPSTGRLYRRYRDGEARFDAHLEDYSFFVHGLLNLFETTGEGNWLDEATGLTKTMVSLFLDQAHGGFFETTGEDGSVIARMKEHYDGAEPSGNSVAAMNLLRLTALTGDPSWRAHAERTLAAFEPILEKQPVVMPHMVSALERLMTPSMEIVLVGPTGDEKTEALVHEVRSRYLPNAAVIRVDTNPGAVPQRTFAASYPLVEGQPAAYVCEDFTCKLPATKPSDLADILGENSLIARPPAR